MDDPFTRLPEGGLWIPRDTTARVEGPGSGVGVVVDNRTDIPDEAVMDYFEQNAAAFGWSSGEMSIQNYGIRQGSMLARAKYRTPTNVIDEMRLARELAERDDDVAATLDMMVGTAFSDGYANQHPDEQVEHTFDRITEDMSLDSALAEFYREWLITGQLNTLTVFTRASYEIRPEGVSRVLTRDVARPMCGVIPAEQIRVLGNDLLGQGKVCYVPADGPQEVWLNEFFSSTTSAARKAEMRREDPLSAALFLEQIATPYNDVELLMTAGMYVYRLNPDMVQRTTMPKGSWKYPRPLLTRNFALLEAKRLLNIMDFALLQGGTNYIVVVKKGTDQRPALPQEIENLREVVKRASATGALIGDHRVSIEVITPDLSELLNPDKRQMIGRKLSQALMRVPEFGSDETGQAVQTFTEVLQRVITWDRNMLRGHIHRNIWRRTMTRNQRVFGRTDRPLLWMLKLILQGNQFFNDYLLKMYDRGDLPRKAMVQYGGFDYDAVKAQKEREVESGHDDIFQPPAVPFSSPENGPGSGPQDSGGGRPPGARTGQPRDPARPRRLIRRTRGETVKAEWDEELQAVVRIGEQTDRLLCEYPGLTEGRLTKIEMAALEQTETHREGPVIVIPVNPEFEIEDVKALNLEDGLRMLIGRRVPDGAIVTRALTFREPHYKLAEAEDTAVRWGFPITLADDGGGGDTATCAECGQTQPASNDQCVQCGSFGLGHIDPPGRRRRRDDTLALDIHIHQDGETRLVRKRIIRGENGEIIGVEEEPAEPSEGE